MMLPDRETLTKGLRNLEKHIAILKSFKQRVLVSLNRYHFDTDEEIAYLRSWCAEKEVAFAVNESFRLGAKEHWKWRRLWWTSVKRPRYRFSIPMIQQMILKQRSARS